MKKYILILLLGLYSLSGFSHQPEASSAVLIEKEPNVWVLQINASLTACQKEVKKHFADTPYKTPQEFNEMLLEHIDDNFDMRFNNGEKLTLNNGVVQLGHETKIIFEISGIPTELKSLTVENKVFEDIYKSQSILVILKENFAKNKFIMNNANEHRLSLAIQNNEFVEIVEEKANMNSTIIFIILGCLGLVLFLKK
ncbi:hypothetical protein ULMS_22650 [Patiriisocius marinistellae]|uniref:Uncharacterized protein n=1 Tax=Patiriisocius marinistellae TaxID=2494560 RepID=A0A5J4FVP6_9FLAO|nr:DUF6702 family protein [Patiriisocius marinistellae]GEQ86757.1 hypothetical protein ULMS_22650 [Patiriisocius marinistellae]